ncbi:hypothetical protein WJ45_15980 [Burkholderia ubonensis]|nr:hypothetical protein WJ45_15980 [Burkholderia ubonensis]KVQ54170.1 hypothetical protein WK04_02725 [Burkholderia ubonensis]
MPILSTVSKRVAMAFVAATVAIPSFGTGNAGADNCWVHAGTQYGVDPLLLYSIAVVESSLNPHAINRNRDGTTDIGLMQINSSNLAGLRKEGITRARLMNDSCTAIHVGARILSGFIERYGYTWEAVGAYNAGGAPEREPLRKTYATQVWRQYRKFTQLRAERAQKRALQQQIQLAAAGG